MIKQAKIFVLVVFVPTVVMVCWIWSRLPILQTVDSQSPTTRQPHQARDNETELLHELEERKSLVAKVCKKYAIHDELGNLATTNSFMLDERNKLAFCRHGKVGTSTLMYYFLQWVNFPAESKADLAKDTNLLHNVLPDLFALKKHGIESVDSFKDFTLKHDILTFSFVRHPFERLVSAFEDKMLYQNDKSYSKLASKVNGSFANFAHHIITTFEKCNGPHKPCKNDVHWRRYVDRCSYCSINYDVIGKMETFSRDVRFIFSSTAVVDEQWEVRQLNAVHHDDHRGERYFRDLPRNVRLKLFQIYRLDFEMFNYDAGKYLTA